MLHSTEIFYKIFSYVQERNPPNQKPPATRETETSPVLVSINNNMMRYRNVMVEIFSIRAKDGATYPATAMIYTTTKSGVALSRPCSIRLAKAHKKGFTFKAKELELEPYVAKHGKLKGKTLYSVSKLVEA